MTRQDYRKAQVKSALATLGTTPAEHQKANEGTLSDRLLVKSFDAESSARYQAKQALLDSLRSEVVSNSNASRILESVGTQDAKAFRHAITPTVAEFVPSC